MTNPLYKVVYDINDNLEDEGIYGVSIVDNPANRYQFIALSEFEEVKLSLDKEKQILTGVVLIPNQRIMRKNSTTGELYELLFEAETIELLSQDFFRKGKQNNSTYNHDDDKWLTGTTVVESWIVEDSENDKANALGFKSLPKGTWMISMKLSDELWNEYVKTGLVTGFSIDSYIQMEKIEMAVTPFYGHCKCELIDGEIITDGTPCDYCQEQINKLNLKEEKMSILQKIIKLFAEEEMEMMTIEIEGLGTITTESLELGKPINLNGELAKSIAFEFEGFAYMTDEEGNLVEKNELVEVVEMEEEVSTEETLVEAEDTVEELIEELIVPVEEVDVDALYSKIAELEAKLELIMKEKETVVMENIELSKQPASTRLKAIIDSKNVTKESTVEALARIVKNKQ